MLNEARDFMAESDALYAIMKDLEMMIRCAEPNLRAGR